MKLMATSHPSKPKFTETIELSSTTIPPSEIPLAKKVTHKESHANVGDIVHDATMGFSDGLTVLFAMANDTHALFVSIGVTAVSLRAFSFAKNYVTVRTRRSGFYGGVQMLLVEVLAAGTSYGIV